VQAAAGLVHSVVLSSDGVVVTSGLNENGQCTIPELPSGRRYVCIAAGGYRTLLLMDDGPSEIRCVTLSGETLLQATLPCDYTVAQAVESLACRLGRQTHAVKFVFPDTTLASECDQDALFSSMF